MKFLRAFFLVFAIILAGSVVYVIGPTKIITNFQLVGWKMGWVFVIGFPRYFIYTLAWKIFLPNEAYTLNRLFQIKVAGELITRSTPIHFVGGDTARVFLMGKNIPRKEAAGSVVMDRTVMTLGAAVVVLMGLVIATFKLPLPLLPKISLWVLVGLIFWGLFFIISHQKRTAFTSVLNLLSKIGFKRWIRPSWKEKVASMDEIIRGYYNRGHGILARSVTIIVIGRLTVALEMYLLMIFLGIPLGPLEAIMFSSMALLMTVAFFLFPGNLGILEGTYGMLFHWIGLDPASGVTMELLRKLNAGLWYLVGGIIAITFKRERRLENEEKLLKTS